MNSKIKICIVVIVIIVLAVICAVSLKKNNDENTNKIEPENIINNEISNEENVIDNNSVSTENVVENKVVNETKNNEQKLETKDFSNSVYEEDSSVGTTDKKQEAINLVKKQWGEDDSVTFSCDSVTSDGIYVIAVTSKERAVVLNYFRVDLSTKTVTIDY